MGNIMDALADISRDILTIFPVHPRTRQRLPGLGTEAPDLNLVEPLSYLDFLALQRSATLVITDSGGIQEETTFLGIPCLTLRENTERPITATLGTNTLVGHDMDRLRSEVAGVLAGNYRKGQVPPLWDGQAAERIAAAVNTWQASDRRPRTATPVWRS
jgi:UDP-N-acetylglucosamine 2-epimerase (non-hydrolysing)